MSTHNRIQTELCPDGYYRAWFDDDEFIGEPSDPVGIGRTRGEAIADLIGDDGDNHDDE